MGRLGVAPEPPNAGSGPTRDLALAGLGGGVFLALHVVFELAWESWFQPAMLDRAWFMGSKTSLVTTQVTLGVVAAVVAARAPGSWRLRLWHAALVAFGAVSVAVGLFFVLGPAEVMVGPVELWPLSLAAAFFLITPGILAGAFLGGYLRDLGTGMSRR